MDIVQLITTGAMGFVGAVVGGYICGYMSKRGEHLATHDDIEMIRTDLAMTTRTTEEIKAELGDRSWDRQRHWEMKRDALFEVIAALGLARDRFAEYMAYKALLETEYDLKEAVSRRQFAKTHVDTRLHSFNDALTDFEQKRHLAAFMCSRDVADALWLARLSMTIPATRVVGDEPFDACEIEEQIQRNIDAVYAAGQRELGCEKS